MKTEPQIRGNIPPAINVQFQSPSDLIRVNSTKSGLKFKYNFSSAQASSPKCHQITLSRARSCQIVEGGMGDRPNSMSPLLGKISGRPSQSKRVQAKFFRRMVGRRRSNRPQSQFPGLFPQNYMVFFASLWIF
jgi:hypothetical protein